MIDDGHLLASSDADLHLQPQLHRRHPLNIDWVFKMLGKHCLGRIFKTSCTLCKSTGSSYASPPVFSELHTLSFTVMIYILPSLTFPLSFTSLTFSLFLPPFLLLTLSLLLLDSKTYSVYFACYKSKTCSLATFSLFDLKEKSKREYTLKYLTQVAMFSSSNSSLRSSMWEENRGSPFALVKKKQ